MTQGVSTEAKVGEVIDACRRYGREAIVALAGVPGTGKSHVAEIAALQLAGDRTLVLEVQFHPSMTYEQFVEGLRIDSSGAVTVEPGIFLEWNQFALDDPDQTYVLLIEELSRADVPAVIGELMTYVEHRERYMVPAYSKIPVPIARNLVILATYNPTDRSAIAFDTALLRRMRILWCPPDPVQLEEMLSGRDLADAVVALLKELFSGCKQAHEADYQHLMPFGHGIFAQVREEVPDLHDLWRDRINHMLYRPLLEPHPFSKTIESLYPWTDPDFRAE